MLGRRNRLRSHHYQILFAASFVSTNMAHKLHLQIASPCRAPWENMDGDERVRFCRECNRNVYNLSAMTEPEARRVIAEREGRVCVRFYQRRDGTVLTTDCPVGRKRRFLSKVAGTAVALAGMAAGLTKLSACGPEGDHPELVGETLMGTPPVEHDWDGGVEEPEQVLMGDVAEPPLMGRIAAPAADD